MTTPRQLAVAKLAASGLNGKDWARLRCAALTARQVGALGFPAGAALRLPYFDLRGRTTKFYRLRYLEPMARDGFALAAGKALRYVQPPDTLNEVYLPPLLPQAWGAVAADPTVSLVVTEGELKAASACAAGVPCAGLGGVWCFKAVKRQLPLLPIFSEFTWPGRTVYVCYDSDAATKADVAAALAELCRALLALGAVPRVVSLPALKGHAKTGLDDFLVAEGKEALAPVLRRAAAFAPAAALYDLNGEVVYVRDPGLVVVLSDGRKLTPGAFREHAYANRYYHEEKVTDQGTKLVKKPAAPAWLGWEHRAELARITYAPGQPQVTADRAFNAWRGWGVEPRRGDVGPWRALLDFLFAGQPATARWVERWCACPLQRPGLKMFSAVVLWGVFHGTGKTLLGHTLLKLYGANGTEVHDKNLEAAHNEWAENRQFVMGDDLNASEEKKIQADRLRATITQKELRLNPKYVPSYTVPDCINYYFTGNHPDQLFLEDHDRRFLVHEVVGPPRERPWYVAYVKWLEGGGAEALFYHLQHVDLGDFDPHAPALVTQAKLDMIEAGQSDLGTWVRRLLGGPDAVLRLGNVSLAGDLWTNQELLHLYDPERRTRVTANGLGRELRKAGARYANGGAPLRLKGGAQVRPYVVRNAAQWARTGPAKLAAHYAATRTPPDPAVKPRKF